MKNKCALIVIILPALLAQVSCGSNKYATKGQKTAYQVSCSELEVKPSAENGIHQYILVARVIKTGKKKDLQFGLKIEGGQVYGFEGGRPDPVASNAIKELSDNATVKDGTLSTSGPKWKSICDAKYELATKDTVIESGISLLDPPLQFTQSTDPNTCKNYITDTQKQVSCNNKQKAQSKAKKEALISAKKECESNEYTMVGDSAAAKLLVNAADLACDLTPVMAADAANTEAEQNQRVDTSQALKCLVADPGNKPTKTEITPVDPGKTQSVTTNAISSDQNKDKSDPNSNSNSQNNPNTLGNNYGGGSNNINPSSSSSGGSGASTLTSRTISLPDQSAQTVNPSNPSNGIKSSMAIDAGVTKPVAVKGALGNSPNLGNGILNQGSLKNTGNTTLQPQGTQGNRSSSVKPKEGSSGGSAQGGGLGSDENAKGNSLQGTNTDLKEKDLGTQYSGQGGGSNSIGGGGANADVSGSVGGGVVMPGDAASATAVKKDLLDIIHKNYIKKEAELKP